MMYVLGNTIYWRDLEDMQKAIFCAETTLSCHRMIPDAQFVEHYILSNQRCSRSNRTATPRIARATVRVVSRRVNTGLFACR